VHTHTHPHTALLNCTEAERAQRPAEKVKAEAPVKGKKDERGERNAGGESGGSDRLKRLTLSILLDKSLR